MPKSTDTKLPPPIERETLKTVIKAVLREMLNDARAGRIELPGGLPNTAYIVDEYKMRLALADALLNPPWPSNKRKKGKKRER